MRVDACAKWKCRDQVTVYGEDFDVVATENPVNVAYTSLPLELHHDLVYLESPPGAHCGLVSRNLTDLFRAAIPALSSV